MVDEEILAVLQELRNDIAEIKAKVFAAPVIIPPPAPPVVSSIWDGLEVTDPLAPFEQTDAGWKGLQYEEFPGDKTMLRAGFDGLEIATGRVMHAGDVPGHTARRKAALELHNLDVAGKYDGTEFAVLNIAPEVAAYLLCNRMVDVGSSLFGAGIRPDRYSNITDLQTLFARLKQEASGGAPSGF